MRRTVLFVCTGNICRSPMAAGLFNAKAKRVGEDTDWVALSAGTWALENQTASGHAITVMKERGIDLTQHRGHQITLPGLDQADVAIVMTQNHRDALAAEFPQHRSKIHLMSEIEGRAYDISDPYGGIFSEYEACAQKLAELIELGYEKIKQWAL